MFYRHQTVLGVISLSMKKVLTTIGIRAADTFGQKQIVTRIL